MLGSISNNTSCMYSSGIMHARYAINSIVPQMDSIPICVLCAIASSKTSEMRNRTERRFRKVLQTCKERLCRSFFFTCNNYPTFLGAITEFFFIAPFCFSSSSPAGSSHEKQRFKRNIKYFEENLKNNSELSYTRGFHIYFSCEPTRGRRTREMKQVNIPAWNAFQEWFRACGVREQVAIFHDADPDGTCSAVLLSLALQRFRGSPAQMHMSPSTGERFLPDDVIELLKKNGVTTLFTTDIALDEKPQQLLKVASFARVIVIDHHKLYGQVSHDNILVLKPQFLVEDIDPSQYCSSKLVYDLCGKEVDLSDKAWIAAVGVISDMTAVSWKEFLGSVFRAHRFSMRKADVSSDWFKTRLGKISTLISSAEVYDPKNVDLCYEILFQATSPRDVLQSSLVQFEREISAEIKKFLLRAKKDAEFFDAEELVYYDVRPKFNIKSPLCTLLSLKYPRKTVLLVTVVNKRVHVSARRQDKQVAVNDLLEEACRNFLNANAGGHIPAAGATFPEEYLLVFKQNILALLQKRKI